MDEAKSRTSTMDGAVPDGELLRRAGATLAGRYHLERELGRGGMGQVFAAHDDKLGRKVAVKMLLRSAAEEERFGRFEQEARAAGGINHPNIVTVYDVAATDGGPCIVTELLEGETVRDLLVRGPLPPERAIDLARQVAEGLTAAHGKGVVHRDLKPANLFLTREGQLKILDFGIAKLLAPDVADEPEHALNTATGRVLGTAAYMSPEQARGEDVDARTDLFSLGVLLYEMLTGRRPFLGSTPALLHDAILNRDPPPVRAARPDTPKALAQLIDRLLAKDRRNRPSSAAEVVTAFKGLRVTPRGSKRAHTWWAATGLALAAGIAGLSWIAFRPPGLIHSVAVAPFGGAPGAAADDSVLGFADALTHRLARAPSLRVFHLSGAEAGPERSAQAIGRELGAEAVLSGRLTPAGGEVLLDARLTRTADGKVLWAVHERRVPADVPTLEVELARRVLASAGAAEAGALPLAGAHPTSAGAYDLYLRGRYHAGRANEPEIDQAIGLLERSVAADPEYAPALAELGVAYVEKAFYFRPEEPEWAAKAYAAIQKALVLDPTSPDAHFARGKELWQPSQGFAHREALAEFRKVLEARPSDDEAWHWRGVVLAHVGHLAGAARATEEAVTLNPGNTQARSRLGPILVYQLRFEEAIAVVRRTPREVIPNRAFVLGWALLSLGRLDEADAEIASALTPNEKDRGGLLHGARAMLRARRGDRTGAAEDIALAAEAGRGFGHFHHTAYAIGAVHAVLGNLDEGQRWIQAAADDGFPNFTYFEKDPNLERLRAVPRFANFLLRLRREWEHIPGEDH